MSIFLISLLKLHQTKELEIYKIQHPNSPATVECHYNYYCQCSNTSAANMTNLKCFFVLIALALVFTTEVNSTPHEGHAGHGHHHNRMIRSPEMSPHSQMAPHSEMTPQSQMAPHPEMDPSAQAGDVHLDIVMWNWILSWLVVLATVLLVLFSSTYAFS